MLTEAATALEHGRALFGTHPLRWRWLGRACRALGPWQCHSRRCASAEITHIKLPFNQAVALIHQALAAIFLIPTIRPIQGAISYKHTGGFYVLALARHVHTRTSLKGQACDTQRYPGCKHLLAPTRLLFLYLLTA